MFVLPNVYNCLCSNGATWCNVLNDAVCLEAFALLDLFFSLFIYQFSLALFIFVTLARLRYQLLQFRVYNVRCLFQSHALVYVCVLISVQVKQHIHALLHCVDYPLDTRYLHFIIILYIFLL